MVQEATVEKLLWVVSRRSVTEIDFVAALAAMVFDHIAKAQPGTNFRSVVLT
jgi:hypothetical protein